jgi:HNH endonuclease
MAKKPRDYRSEYDSYQGTEEQKKNRAARNTARRRMEAAGKVKKGQDVDHLDSNPRNNDPSNLKAKSVKKNRGKRDKNGKTI